MAAARTCRFLRCVLFPCEHAETVIGFDEERVPDQSHLPCKLCMKLTILPWSRYGESTYGMPSDSRETSSEDGLLSFEWSSTLLLDFLEEIARIDGC